ncbi:hypothetical protein ACTFIY_002235 [Dictyostelium cf. discoideum]
MKIIIILLIFLNLITNINCAVCSSRLQVSDIKFANTHVLPIEGKSWKNNTVTLKILPNRESLLLAKFEDQTLSYTVKVWVDDTLIGKLTLNDPSKLPPTESNGTKYSTVHHSIRIPKEWMKPKMKIQFSTMLLKSEFFFPNIGHETNLNMWLLPFYLFGANDTNTQPLSVTGSISKDVSDELVQKWSLSSLNALNHPISRIDWPYLILPAGRNGLPGLRITNSDQKRDGYEIMSVVLGILGGIRGANGEGPSSILYYAPLIHLGANGKYADPWGGLGGGSVGTGDYSYTGIFIHEAGHSYGLPHAGDSYKSGNYPYVDGSLLGSEWGFDMNHNEFLSVNIPSNIGAYKNCNKSFILDQNKNCVKQSVMQGGAGNQAQGYRYSMFADYEEVTIQNYFKDSIIYDKSFSTGYKKWNTTTLKYETYTPSTKSNGLYGLNDGLPIERNVDVYTIIITHSFVGPANLSQIYPIFKSKGNLMYFFDPTNSTQLVDIKPNVSKYAWYCHASGCDYTIKITYTDGTTKYMLLQRGKRSWFSPSGAIGSGFTNPLSGDSSLSVIFNIKADKTPSKVELFETLLGFNGFDSTTATLLVSQSF